MKRFILLVLLIPILLPASAGAFGWFRIASTILERLDHDSYRLRVEVEYGGIYFGDAGGFYEGTFSRFSLTPLFGSSQYNPTQNTSHVNAAYTEPGYNNPGDWFGGRNLATVYPLGMTWDVEGRGVFGYDFDQTDPFEGPIAIDYYASFASQPMLGKDGIYRWDEVDFSGTVTVPTASAEPATILLFGAGFLGFCAMGIRRKMRKQ